MTRIEISSSPYDVIKACEKAIQNKLYVPGWQAFELFQQVISPWSDEIDISIAMYYEDEKPIAWVVLWKKSDWYFYPSAKGSLWRFTLSSYRNQGISSVLASELRNSYYPVNEKKYYNSSFLLTK
jgi:hypothetical protein